MSPDKKSIGVGCKRMTKTERAYRMHLAGASVADIALAIGSNAACVRVHLWRARKIIRDGKLFRAGSPTKKSGSGALAGTAQWWAERGF